MIVTLDGPAGAGKSSAAKALARRLGFDFLDTGAMYRAVALTAQRRRATPSSVAQAIRQGSWGPVIWVGWIPAVVVAAWPGSYRRCRGLGPRRRTPAG